MCNAFKQKDRRSTTTLSIKVWLTMEEKSYINIFEELNDVSKRINSRECEKNNIETDLRALNGYAATIVNNLDSFGAFGNLRKAFYEHDLKTRKSILKYVFMMFFDDNYKKVKFKEIIDRDYSLVMVVRFLVGEQEYEIHVPNFKYANAKNWTDCIFRLSKHDEPDSIYWTYIYSDYNYVSFKKYICEYIFGGKSGDTNNKQ